MPFCSQALCKSVQFGDVLETMPFCLQALCKSVQFGDVIETMQLLFSGANVCVIVVSLSLSVV